MDTPKHFAAIAASKNIAAFGNVIWETAKKDDRLWGARAAQRDSKYSPKTATDPLNRHVIVPGIMPADAIAYSLASNILHLVGIAGRTKGNVSIPLQAVNFSHD